MPRAAASSVRATPRRRSRSGATRSFRMITMMQSVHLQKRRLRRNLLRLRNLPRLRRFRLVLLLSMPLKAWRPPRLNLFLFQLRLFHLHRFLWRRLQRLLLSRSRSRPRVLMRALTQMWATLPLSHQNDRREQRMLCTGGGVGQCFAGFAQVLPVFQPQGWKGEGQRRGNEALEDCGWTRRGLWLKLFGAVEVKS